MQGVVGVEEPVVFGGLELLLHRMGRGRRHVGLGAEREEMPHAGRDGQAELGAGAEADVGGGRRHHLDRTADVAQLPGVNAGLRVAEGPFGMQAAGLQSAGPAESHLQRRPVEHHPHAAERAGIGVAERHHPEVQPRGGPNLDGLRGRRRSWDGWGSHRPKHTRRPPNRTPQG